MYRIFALLILSFIILGCTPKNVKLDMLLAEDGDMKAQQRLGNHFYFSKDYEKAVYWYTKASKQGNADAQFQLGNCYYYGQGIPKDEKAAVDLYKLSAEQSNACAQVALGSCYLNGDGVNKDFKKAVDWYAKAYKNGIEYKLTELAEKGNPYAQYNLAECLSFTKRDEKIKWLTKSADQGYMDAIKTLRFYYSLGIFCKKDEEKAEKWLKKAAENGDTLSQAIIGEKEYLSQNYKNGVYWLLKAAEGNHETVDYVQNLLGEAYYCGKGVEKDYKKAVYWFSKSAENGSAEAQFNLGVCYAQGEGVLQDNKKAFYWFNKAADQGNEFGQYNLGVFYLQGKGVLEDERKAVEWFYKSAEQGHDKAQLLLGESYYYGWGVTIDKKQAKEWMQKSANQGNEKANDLLKELF